MQDNPRSVPEDEIAPSFTPVGGVGSGLPNQGQRASGKRAIKVFMLAIITKEQRNHGFQGQCGTNQGRHRREGCNSVTDVIVRKEVS